MKKRDFEFLRKALTEPLGVHLDSESLVELVYAELTGVDLERRYATELRHIEGCVACAEAYSELADLAAASENEMSQAAAALTPQESALEDGSAIGWAQRASEVWGRVMQYISGVDQGWRFLRLEATPEAVVTTLGARQTGEQWDLADVFLDEPIPLRLIAQAKRLDALTCQVIVRIDRPGLQSPAGRPVQLVYAGQVQEVLTDATGAARFAPIPVTSILGIEVRFRISK